jgi:glycosyltransferase involved in cell wall biosynthesis
MVTNPLAGFLCYNLSPAATSTLVRVAQAAADFRVKAYPLLGPLPPNDLPFPYRPARGHGRFVSFTNASGTAPETQLLTLGLPVVRDLVAEADLICLLGIQSIPAVLAALLARGSGKPILAISQTMGPLPESRRPAVIRLLKGLVLRLADRHVAQTPPTSQTLRQIYGIAEDRIVLAPWDGAAGEFMPILERHRTQAPATLRSASGIPPTAYVVTFCGTLLHLKGVDVLLGAFAVLLERHPQSLLLIVGEDGMVTAAGRSGGKRSELEQMARARNVQANVRFLGQQSWDQLARIYLASDVFVLPSRKDVWPKVLVEAALAGLPLVTSDVCGGAGHLVRPGVNGFVVPVEDAQALSQALLALTDPALRRQMGAASRQIVQEYIVPGAEAAGYTQAIRDALRAGRSRTGRASGPLPDQVSPKEP